MARERHFKAMELSEDGLYVVHGGFLRHAPIRTIAQKLKEVTGETISGDTLQRYRKWWRSEHRPAEEAREMAREMATALRDNPTEDLRRIIEQKMEQLLLLELRNVEGRDPIAVADLVLRQRKVSMRQEQLVLEEERERVRKDRLALDREKLEAQRQKKAAINRPALFLEFFKGMVETLVPVDPQAAEVLNKHFNRLMAKVKAAHA